MNGGLVMAFRSSCFLAICFGRSAASAGEQSGVVYRMSAVVRI
jgi:hypothetical protein